MNELLCTVLVAFAIVTAVTFVISFIVWIIQIYESRKTINAILDHLGFHFPYGESMNKLTKEEEK